MSCCVSRYSHCSRIVELFEPYQRRKIHFHRFNILSYLKRARHKRDNELFHNYVHITLVQFFTKNPKCLVIQALKFPFRD